MDTKQCRDCGKIDLKDNFAKNRLMCKSCYSEHQKQKRLKNIDKLKEYDKKRYTGERKMKQLETSKQWYTDNKNKALKRINNRYKNNKEKIHLDFRLNKYNLTKQEYTEMINKNDGNCQICNNKFDKMCIDHDHDTGQVRGILCNNCNSGIGFLKDSVDMLRLAIQYLENSKEEDFTIGYSGYFFGAKKGVHLGRINTQ